MEENNELQEIMLYPELSSLEITVLTLKRTREIAIVSFRALAFSLGIAGSSSIAFAENLVVIGDSQSCGFFGFHFASDLEKFGHKVSLYCIEGSSPKNWINSSLPSARGCKMRSFKRPQLHACSQDGRPPPLDEILGSPDVNRVIIQLGGNSLSSSQPDQYYGELARRINASNKHCDWHSPAWRQPDKSPKQSQSLTKANANLPSFVKNLREQVGQYCNVIDTSEITGPGRPGNETVDGVHRTLSAGKAWANWMSRLYEPKPSRASPRPAVR